MKRHFIVTAIGSAGDVHPLARLAQALKGRGHHVTFMANGYFAPLAERMALDFVALGSAEEFRHAMSDPLIWHPRLGFKTVWGYAQPSVQLSYDWIAQNHTPQTVLVGSTLALGARIARDAFRLPLATVHLAPSVLLSSIDPPLTGPMPLPSWLPRRAVSGIWWLAERLMLDPTFMPSVNQTRAQAGLPPVRHIMRRYLHSPDLVLLFYPDWFAPNPGDWPEHTVPVGFPRFDEAGLHDWPEGLNDFLQSGPPPLLFTPGSAMQHAHSFFSNAIQSCEALNQRAIVVTPYTQQLPPLPSSVLQLDYLPFSQLLPHVQLVAHHGGIGTCSQGLAAGLPQLVVANAHDQFDNGNRLKRLGVGEFLSAGGSPALFQATLRQLLENPTYSQNAQHWQQQLTSSQTVLDASCHQIENCTFMS